MDKLSHMPQEGVLLFLVTHHRFLLLGEMGHSSKPSIANQLALCLAFQKPSSQVKFVH